MLKNPLRKDKTAEDTQPDVETKPKKIFFKAANYTSNGVYILNEKGNVVEGRQAAMTPGIVHRSSAIVHVSKDLKGAYLPENPEDYRPVELSINGFRVTACPGIDHQLVFPYTKEQTAQMIADFVKNEDLTTLDISDVWDDEKTTSQIKSALDGMKFALTADTENRDNRNAEINAMLDEFKAVKEQMVKDTRSAKALLAEHGLSVAHDDPADEIALKAMLLKRKLAPKGAS